VRFFAGLLAAVATCATLAAAYAQNFPARMIRGATLHGFQDKNEFYDYFAPDGSTMSLLVGTGDVSHGRYTIEDGDLCLNYPGDKPLCYKFTGLPPALTMIDDGTGQITRVRLLWGNPKKLR